MSPPITTPSELESYLKAHDIAFTSVTLLTGGTANFVYRVLLPSNETLIFKHAAPFLWSNVNFAFPAERMDYESTALQRIPGPVSAVLPDSIVRPVQWRGYDSDAKLLQISDGGERNLKVAYEDAALDIPFIGSEIGKWIAALHLSGHDVSLNPNDPKDLQHNNPVAVNIYRHSYANLSKALEGHGEDPNFGKWVDAEYGSRLASENEVLCHGDLWPGNVLVKPGKEGLKKPQLTIVDWEMTRRGSSATDVAQFAAESFLLDRFKGARGLRAAFLTAYVKSRGDDGLNREWIKRFSTHWGTHVAFWPTRAKWVGKDETHKLVLIGIDIIKAARDERWDELGKSELFKELEEDWNNYWNIV